MSDHFWVIIPAAGKGHRFSKELPKQYWTIENKTILEYAIEIFLAQNWVNHIFIPLSEDDTFFSTLTLAKNPKITTLIGEMVRMNTVINALRELKKQAQPNDWVLVHDAVRPCLHHDDLNRLIETVIQSEVGGILASPLQDTIKYVDQNKKIHHTVNREQLWAASTPQIFRLHILEEALIHCDANQHVVTDEASAFEYRDLFPQVVEARYPNPKLTYPRDLTYITFLLSQKTEVIA